MITGAFFFFFAIQFKGFGQTTETQTAGSIKERHVAGCHKEPPALFIKIKQHIAVLLQKSSYSSALKWKQNQVHLDTVCTQR